MKRSGPLKRNVAMQRAWEQRSRNSALARERNQPRKPLPSESPKRKAEREQRDEVRAYVLKRDGRCMAADIVPEVRCWHPSGEPLDVDEIKLRSGVSSGHLDPDNCQALCRRHHEWKHNEPDEAVARGLRVWAHRS